MNDEVLHHEPNGKGECNLDTDETDCYSSACEDDESIGTSDDEGSSDTVFEPFVPEPGTSDFDESSDTDILENNYRRTPGGVRVGSPDVNKPIHLPDECQSSDDGFQGFDDEIQDNRGFRLFEKFMEVDCLCANEIKEEEGEEDTGGNRILGSPERCVDEIKEEERAQECREGNGNTATPIRKTKKKAKSFLQPLKQEYGVEEKYNYSDGDYADDEGENVLDQTHEEVSEQKKLLPFYHNGVRLDPCFVKLTPIPDGILRGYGLEKQEKSVGKEADIEAHGRELWCCDQCSFRTNFKREFNLHEWTHKQDREWYKCSICGLKFGNTRTLFSHVKKKHENPDKSTKKGQNQDSNIEYLCSICGLKFTNILSLRTHIVSKHENPHKKPKNGRKQHSSTINYYYKFAQCNYSSNNKSQYTTHMMNHAVEKPGFKNKDDKEALKKQYYNSISGVYECTQCNYTSTGSSSFKTHMMTHTGERPCACPHCPYRARRQSHLEQHLLFHMSLKPYKCTICGYKTRQKSHLTTHMLSVHTDDKPFKCSSCEFTAKAKSTRDLHFLSQHTDIKRYACKLCPFKSAHHSVLSDHNRGHEENLDYTCPESECTWSCRSSLSMSNHIAGCHPGSKSIRNCRVCEYRTTDVTTLQNHLRIKHRIS